MATTPMPVAVVTGAAGAIGSAICTRLVADGWSVVGLDLNTGLDPSVDWRVVDVTDTESMAHCVASLERTDLLINGAGFGDSAPAEDMTAEQWTSVVEGNLTGTFKACRAFYPHLAATGGTVVNIASTAAKNALELHANYCAAKAGVVALTEVLAIEWAEAGIRVLSVSPGFVATPRLKAGLEKMPARRAEIEMRTPLGRTLETDEIAHAIVELAGPKFAYLSGSDVVIDGGWSTDGGGGRLFRAATKSDGPNPQ